MGGGDLNLKKSWHPSTLRNIERVWKAEQKHEVEKQKIEQLQKELQEEREREEIKSFAEEKGVIKKRDERLDWMYQGPAAMVNREEYLMGRKIDKTFETLQQLEKGVENPKEEVGDVGPSMFSSQNLSGTATVDLAAKIREDPLFNIMKKEKEERKNLLSNPMKMKQLQQLLKASLGESSGKKNKKSKKKKHQQSDSEEDRKEKRRKKHKRHDSSDSDDEGRTSSKHMPNYTSSKHNVPNGYISERRSRLEESPQRERKSKQHEDISSNGDYYEKSSHKKNKYSSYETQKSSHHYDSKRRIRSEESHSKHHEDISTNGNYYDESYHKKSKSSHKYQEYNDNHVSERRMESEKSSRKERKSKHREDISSNGDYYGESSHRRNKYSSYEYQEDSDRPSKESRSSNKESSHKNYQDKDDAHNRHENRSGEPKPYRRHEEKDKPEPKKKLDAAERDRLLREMQENAKWMDEQRRKQMQRYRDEEKEEENAKRDASEFIKPMLSKAAGKGSLENRIKQKVFTIQRGSFDMDKNFAKRH